MMSVVRRHSKVTGLILVFMSLAVVGIGLLVAYAQEETHVDAPPHWEYEGEAGPDAWGSLSEQYALCATGQAQSPINITAAQSLNLSDIEFNYSPSALNIFNNGHTIQVGYDGGSGITYNELYYELKQFHFHTPSEHTIEGESFPMEIHFVHQNSDGALAVVGVMLRETAETDNAAYAPIFDNMPAEKGDPQPTELTIDANSLLPAAHLFTTYGGSLTTPPCSQGVRWLVLAEPVDLSAAQIEAFHTIFEANARPVQPLNTRDLLEDSSAGS